jgi:hypothetical protein
MLQKVTPNVVSLLIIHKGCYIVFLTCQQHVSNPDSDVGLAHIMWSPNYFKHGGSTSKNIQLFIHKITAKPTLLYGSEILTWVGGKKNTKKEKAFQEGTTF